jgi:hypothetical protein
MSSVEVVSGPQSIPHSLSMLLESQSTPQTFNIISEPQSNSPAYNNLFEPQLASQPFTGFTDLKTQLLAPYSASFADAVDTIDAMHKDIVSLSTTLPRDRVVFSVQQFKSYPAMLLSQGRTPFIHPSLYNEDVPLPYALEEAYSACALYLSRTDNTTPTILRIIERKNNALVATAGTWTIAEHLAALQAMCLFQIIRLFDGDIRQRALADEQESLLLDWATKLQSRMQDQSSDFDSCQTSGLAPGTSLTSNGSTDRTPNSHTTNIPPSWSSWVFAESVRRTLIVSWMINGVYAVVKQGFCYYSEVVTTLPFTASAQLWRATSAYHFEKAWREKRHFDVINMNFGEILDPNPLIGATDNDVDELGILMICTYLGVDRLREWVAV